MNADEPRKRPLVRYHGGKWKLAPWIISHFPEHRIYVEPFGGGGSVLLRKARSYAEVYNDLDCEMVNLFRITRDRGDELHEVLQLTPFSRDDYLEAWNPSGCPLEQARRTVIRSFMGFGSAAITSMRAVHNTKRGGLAKTGFRANSNRSGTTPAGDWRNYPEALLAIIDRLRGVVIENRPGIKVMESHDGPSTLHYVDPPYLAETRDAGGDYRHEMDTSQHEALAHSLSLLKGAVILRGYPSDLYERLYAGWRRVEKTGPFADGAAKRTEVLWMKNIEIGELDLNIETSP